MPVGPPPPMRERLSYLLGVAHARLLEQEAAALAPLGVTIKEHAVLAMLVGDGPVAQQEIGRRLGIDRTTVVAVVDRLDGAGLVERRRHPDDRRAYLVTPTDRGRDVHSRGSAVVTEAERTALSGLDDRQRAALVDLLARAESPLPAQPAPGRET